MDISDLLTWKYLALALFATGLAVVIWLNTPPVNKWGSIQDAVVDIVTKFAAAFLVGWGAMEAGTDVYTLIGFALMVGGALGGVATIEAIITKVAQLKESTTATDGSGPPQ